MRFDVAIRLPLVHPISPATLQRRFHPFLHKPLFHTVNFLHAEVQHPRNHLVRRSLLLERSLIAVQKNQGIQNLLRTMAAFRGNLIEVLAFVLRQRDLVFLHGSLHFLVEP